MINFTATQNVFGMESLITILAVLASGVALLISIRTIIETNRIRKDKAAKKDGKSAQKESQKYGTPSKMHMTS